MRDYEDMRNNSKNAAPLAKPLVSATQLLSANTAMQPYSYLLYTNIMVIARSMVDAELLLLLGYGYFASCQAERSSVLIMIIMRRGDNTNEGTRHISRAKHTEVYR